MSTRSKRKAAPTFQGGDSVEPEEFDESDASSVHSRRQEKKFLGNLNNRLAQYIEKVRSLELENSRLQTQIKDIEVVEKRKRNETSNDYTQKIADLRQQLEEVKKANQIKEMARKTDDATADTLKKKTDKLEKELRTAHTEVERLQNIKDKTAQNLQQTEKRCSQLESENNDLREQLSEFIQRADALKDQLEEETLLRSEAMARIEALEEDLHMEKRKREQEMDEVYRKREIEYTRIGEQLETQFDNELRQRIDEFRAESDARIKQNRKDVEDKYAQKINELQKSVDQQRNQVLTIREDLSKKMSQLKEAERKGREDELSLKSMQVKLTDTEARYGVATDLLHAKESEIRDLKKEVDRLNDDYKDLMDVKLQLDDELSTYNMLLQGEESRLNIRTPNTTRDENLHVSFEDEPRAQNVSGSMITSSPRRGTKRRRVASEEFNDISAVQFDRLSKHYETETDAEGELSIDHVDPEGAYIRILNNGAEDIPMQGYKLVVKDTHREVTFKFSAKMVLKAGRFTTVYSHNAGESTRQPNKFAMKENWPNGPDGRICELYNEEDRVIAILRMRLEGMGHELGTEGEDRCCIM